MNTSYLVFPIIGSTWQSCFDSQLSVAICLMKFPLIAVRCGCSFEFLLSIIGFSLMSAEEGLLIFIFPAIDVSFVPRNLKVSFYTSWPHHSICHCLLLSPVVWYSIMIFLAHNFLIIPQACLFLVPKHWICVNILKLYFWQHSTHFLIFGCW